VGCRRGDEERALPIVGLVGIAGLLAVVEIEVDADLAVGKAHSFRVRKGFAETGRERRRERLGETAANDHVSPHNVRG
jgi:hypothetical protein